MLNIIAAAVSIVLSTPPLRPTPVLFSLTSTPPSGGTVFPGQSVTWRVDVSAPTASNHGLAGFSFDFVQSPSNPATFDMTPSAAVPTAMFDFSRPRGISNPQPGNLAVSAYSGTPIGAPGTKNLIQIGGMQNTFGVAGTLIGTDTAVETGVGQGPLPLLVAQGSFTVPSAAGMYCFELQSIRTNILSVANPVNGIYDVRSAALDSSSVLSFCYSVAGGPTCDSIDFNNDGVSPDSLDITDFLSAFGGGACSNDPNCNDIDFNNDGITPDSCDIDIFLEVFGGMPCREC